MTRTPIICGLTSVTFVSDFSVWWVLQPHLMASATHSVWRGALSSAVQQSTLHHCLILVRDHLPIILNVCFFFFILRAAYMLVRGLGKKMRTWWNCNQMEKYCICLAPWCWAKAILISKFLYVQWLHRILVFFLIYACIYINLPQCQAQGSYFAFSISLELGQVTWDYSTWE